VPPLHICVSLSARQLCTPADLPGTISAVLNRTGIPAASLWLELTDSALLEDSQPAATALRGLAALGVTLCLDDSSTGYSSLSYLHGFQAGTVKTDRSFVSGIGTAAQDETIAQTIITAAHQLGRRVLADGVETASQRDWLRARGCDLVQGPLYGPPAPPATVRDVALHGRNGA
jgi:EAL domain-containing protein (putative c-di-GMP-specific phosphodiesterase class I)